MKIETIKLEDCVGKTIAGAVDSFEQLLIVFTDGTILEAEADCYDDNDPYFCINETTSLLGYKIDDLLAAGVDPAIVTQLQAEREDTKRKYELAELELAKQRYEMLAKRLGDNMTRPHSELIEIAFQFVADCTPQGVLEHAAELECLGKHGAKIPPMRAHQWNSILWLLIVSGRLTERDGVLVAPVANDDKQMMLF